MTLAEALAKLHSPHGSGLLARLGGAQRMLDAGRPISTSVAAKIDNEAIQVIETLVAALAATAAQAQGAERDPYDGHLPDRNIGNPGSPPPAPAALQDRLRELWVSHELACEAADALDEQAAELAALIHDIARYVERDTQRLAELERAEQRVKELEAQIEQK